jgi:hypothetical protein
MIKNIYLGSIISSYIEYQTKPININIELIFDTNFLISLLDLNTPESTHTCNKLVQISKSIGYNLKVLDITISETRNLLERRADNFNNAFLAKNIDPEDIYNACNRNNLNKTDLQNIADNLEEKFKLLDIDVIPHTDKYQKIARFSKEFEKLKSLRNNEFAALHDATVLTYVKDKRNNKPIKDFDKVNCWFVNNSSSWQSSESLISNGTKHQPETIRAEDFINILWLSNPNINKQLSGDDLADIGITRMISCTLNETLPKSAIIRELDNNIKKYAAEVISDKDIIRVATRITNRNLKNLEELNHIADVNSEEFIKRLQKEADIEREESENRIKELQEFIQHLEKNNKQLSDLPYDSYSKLKDDLKFERKIRLKAENDLIKINRDKYLSNKKFKWRLCNWIELIVIFLIFILFFLFLLFKSKWNIVNAMELYKSLNNYFIYLFWLLELWFSIVSLKSLVAKYRNHSNIKAFMETIEKNLPENLRDKLE